MTAKYRAGCYLDGKRFVVEAVVSSAVIDGQWPVTRAANRLARKMQENMWPEEAIIKSTMWLEIKSRRFNPLITTRLDSVEVINLD